MAGQDEQEREARAERIRELKDSASSEVTWRYIADYVGVDPRSAAQWAKTGGISYSNVKRLAKVFEVDADWLWRGDRSQTPDLSQNGRSPEDMVRALLREQSRILKDIKANQLEIKDALAALPAVARALDALLQALEAERRPGRLAGGEG